MPRSLCTEAQREAPALGLLVAQWAHALTRHPAPRAGRRCEGHTGSAGSSGPPRASLWATAGVLQGCGGLGRDGKEGAGRVGDWEGLGLGCPLRRPSLGHRRGRKGPAVWRRHLWPHPGSGFRGCHVAPGAPLPSLRAAWVGAQASSSLLPSLESSFRFWAMSFICCRLSASKDSNSNLASFI